MIVDNAEVAKRKQVITAEHNHIAYGNWFCWEKHYKAVGSKIAFIDTGDSSCVAIKANPNLIIHHAAGKIVGKIDHDTLNIIRGCRGYQCKGRTNKIMA